VAGARDFSLTASRPNPPSYSLGTAGEVSRGIEWPGHDADHSHPSNAEVRIVELYLQSPIRFHEALLN
jgi:hypothetical protein